MPRAIGYSTGSLAAGDYRSALNNLKAVPAATAVELSALREDEIEPLMRDLGLLDLTQFEHISVHAPSALERYSEGEVVTLLQPAVDAGYPIIVHADVIRTVDTWRSLGDLLWIENMDKRKHTGRFAFELNDLFQALPKARMCLDMAYARQIDPSLCELLTLLSDYRDRLGQIHLSELRTDSKHEPLSFAAVSAFEGLTCLIPRDVPIILEFYAERSELRAYIQLVRNLFSGGLKATPLAG